MSKFYVVATPIGNMGDITLRAIETLKAVDLILCEDTRQTKKLLDKYNISKPTMSYPSDDVVGKNSKEGNKLEKILGFLPHKKGRETLFKEIASAERTMVFYESPHRILKTLESLQKFCPHKKVCLARELTKIYE